MVLPQAETGGPAVPAGERRDLLTCTPPDHGQIWSYGVFSPGQVAGHGGFPARGVPETR